MDFEELLQQYVDDDGNIGKDNLEKLTEALSKAVGKQFVPKARYDKKLREINTLKEAANDAADEEATGTNWKQKYDDEVIAHQATKDGYAANELAATKTAALSKALSTAGANDKAIALMIKGVDLAAVELNKDGNIKDADKVIAPIKSEYGDFFGTVHKEGVDAGSPPAGGAPSDAPKTLADAIRGKIEGSKT